MAIERRLQQRACGLGHVGLASLAGQVVPLLVHFARQGGNLQLLQWRRQWHDGIHTLEQGARGLGVFGDPVAQARHLLKRGLGQHVGDRRQRRFAAEVQRRWHQIQGAAHAVAPARTGTPAARSRLTVLIRGSPTSAVGSSLCRRASRAMPRASLLALPAQS